MRRWAIALALLMASTQFAFAQDEPPVPDPARPAIGNWTGSVSWSEHVVSYGWQITPDGAFSSGRSGRGHTGGGVWNAHGSHVTLKYDDGFRYEGELSGDAYTGEAFGADGRRFGAFSMSRDIKRDTTSYDEE